MSCFTVEKWEGLISDQMAANCFCSSEMNQFLLVLVLQTMYRETHLHLGDPFCSACALFSLLSSSQSLHYVFNG